MCPATPDAAATAGVFHWIDREKQADMIAHVFDALKPQGQFIFEFGGRGQVDLAVHMAHAAHEVAVRGGDAALPGGQNAHIAAQARPAGGGGDDAARVQEYWILAAAAAR